MSGNLALGGGDPRLSIVGDEHNKPITGHGAVEKNPSRIHRLALRDPNIKFEE